MLYYGSEVSRQLARERAEELAREYRPLPAASDDEAQASQVGAAALLRRIGRRRPRRAPAYRA